MNDKNQNSAEIDLLYFFKPVINFLTFLVNVIRQLLRKIFLNKILFFSIVLIISSAGFSLRYFMHPAYETQGLFVSNTLPGKYCSLLIDNLNKLKSPVNAGLIAENLKISEEAARDLLSVKLTPSRDTFLIEKKDSAISILKITLIVNSFNHLDSIQWALVNYLENSEYAIKRKLAKQKALEAMKSNLNKKLESLDSLKKVVNSSIIPRSEAKGIILGEPIDPVSVYQAEVAYYREQLNIDQALATIDNIEILQPFYKLSRPNYPHFTRLFAWSFLASLGLALLVILFAGKKLKAD